LIQKISRSGGMPYKVFLIKDKREMDRTESSYLMLKIVDRRIGLAFHLNA
jgi:hypothetical protein